MSKFARYKKIYNVGTAARINQAIKAATSLISYHKRREEGEYEKEDREDVTDTYSGELDETDADTEAKADITDTGTEGGKGLSESASSNAAIIEQVINEELSKDLSDKARALMETTKNLLNDYYNAPDVFETKQQINQAQRRTMDVIRDAFNQYNELSTKESLYNLNSMRKSKKGK